MRDRDSGQITDTNPQPPRWPRGRVQRRCDLCLAPYRAPRVLTQLAPRPDVIEVSDLVRRFGEFAVDGISFEVPEWT
jgi:hypothetical protein